MKEWTNSMPRWKENANNISNDCNLQGVQIFPFRVADLPTSGSSQSNIVRLPQAHILER